MRVLVEAAGQLYPKVAALQAKGEHHTTADYKQQLGGMRGDGEPEASLGNKPVGD